jgi:hypothetical protein
LAAEPAVVLEEWRRAERLLQLMPPRAPETAQIEAQIEKMRDLYQALTRSADVSHAKLEASRRRIAATGALLDAAADRYGLDRRAVVEPAPSAAEG